MTWQSCVENCQLTVQTGTGTSLSQVSTLQYALFTDVHRNLAVVCIFYFATMITCVSHQLLFITSWLSFHRFASSFSVQIAPETTAIQRQSVKKVLAEVYGTENSDQWQQRRSEARIVGEEDESLNIPLDELVYGELGIDALATILDAVGVNKGDNFLDIGAGDGMLVTGASMLYPDFLEASIGAEIVPDLYERSLEFQSGLERLLEMNQSEENILLCPQTSLHLGNCYQPHDELKGIFSNTTLAVCFATAWCRGIPGRKLERLSEALGTDGVSELPAGARLVIIDGVLDHQRDGFDLKGELKFFW